MPDPTLGILDDIAAGETLVLLADLRDEPFMPRRSGKKLDKSVPFRWATRGSNGVRLESIVTPTGKATTKNAVLRFFARLSGHMPTPAGQTPRTRARAISAAERELAAAGI